MKVSENVCPVCKTKNELKAVVCGHCGAPLEDPFLDPGARTKTTDIPALDAETIQGWSIGEATVPETGIAIYIEGELRPAYVDSTGEFIIGRKAGDISDVSFDMSALGGYHLGLSRRHAVIRRTQHGYEIRDLGSANGTWLKDEKLVPHKSYPLASGSHLRLGSMRLLVLYRPLAETKQ